MIHELLAIRARVIGLEEIALSNLPESQNFVLNSYSEELTGYKVTLEEMFEKTDNKENMDRN